MPELRGTPRVFVQVGGVPVEDVVLRTLSRLEVERAWNVPALAALTFVDPPESVTERDLFPMGKKLEIQVQDGPGAIHDLGWFEISTSNWRYSSAGELQLEIEALDALHRMDLRQTGVNRRTSTVRQVLEELCNRSRLKGPTGDIPIDILPSLLQGRGTDLELFARMTNQANRRFVLRDRTVVVRSPGDGEGAATELKWSEGLLQIDIRTSLEDQVGATEARAWDPNIQRAWKVRADSPQRKDLDYEGKSGPKTAASVIPAAPLMVQTRPLPGANDARRAAQAELDRRAESFLHIEGICDGEPALLPGSKVKLSGISRLHRGTYVVDRVMHRVDATEGWLTRFEVGSPPPAPASRPRETLTCTPAVVKDVDDPRGQGRIRVAYRALGDRLVSHWLRVVHPGAGDGGGLFVTPHVGDEVLVLLESDSLDAGYVIGGLYSRKNKLAAAFEQASSPTQGFQSRKEHRIEVDDTKDTIEIRVNRGARIKLKQGHLLLASNGSIDMRDGRGSRVRLNRDGVHVLSANDMKIHADGSRLEIKGNHVVIAGSRIDFKKV